MKKRDRDALKELSRTVKSKQDPETPLVDDARVLEVVVEDGAALPVIGIEVRVEGEEEDDGQPARLMLRSGTEAGDALALMVYPVRRERFLADFWERRALLVRGNGRSRLDDTVMEDYLLGLDAEQLVHASPSDEIHVWLASPSGGPAQSFKASPETALQCYRSGACSLYFRAPQPLIDSMISAMGFALGAQFGAWAADGSLQGEIETFLSRRGNVTQCHYDFQENFTFQLRGSKRWTLRRSGVAAPLRGFTPHFSGLSQRVADQQCCAARMDAATSHWNVFDCLDEEEATTVTLHEGDVFYHPSGLMHEVECISDECVSINLSLDLLRGSEYLVDAARAAARALPALRRHLVGGRDREALAEQLRQFQAAVAGLTVDAVFPPGLWRAAPNPGTEFDSAEERQPLALARKRLRKNPLAVVLEGREDEDGALWCRFAFNCGTEELDSWLLTELRLTEPDDLWSLSSLLELLEGAEHGLALQPESLSRVMHNCLALLVERGVLLLAD